MIDAFVIGVFVIGVFVVGVFVVGVFVASWPGGVPGGPNGYGT
ncbi:hypothetical protein [Micromonospora zingiberis]|nr:hypothetical protein [Micromonospora zingiberis]